MANKINISLVQEGTPSYTTLQTVENRNKIYVINSTAKAQDFVNLLNSQERLSEEYLGKTIEIDYNWFISALFPLLPGATMPLNKQFSFWVREVLKYKEDFSDLIGELYEFLMDDDTKEGTTKQFGYALFELYNGEKANISETLSTDGNKVIIEKVARSLQQEIVKPLNNSVIISTLDSDNFEPPSGYDHTYIGTAYVQIVEGGEQTQIYYYEITKSQEDSV